MKTVTGLVLALVLLGAACGGDDDTGSADGASVPDVDVDAAELIEDPEAAVEDLAESLSDVQESQGGGSATLTVGDQTWTFDSVLCAFGEDEIGQEGAEFVLSSIQDGMQLYASIDSFGHSVSLNDIEDFENPRVNLTAFGGGEFVQVDGKSAQASADFTDGTSDDFATIPGTFEATCP